MITRRIIAAVVCVLALAVGGVARDACGQTLPGPVEDRRPFYVVPFLSNDAQTAAPPLSWTRREWRQDPRWIFGPMQFGWDTGFRRFVLHVPHGTPADDFTSAVWTNLPASHQSVLAVELPAWIAAHPGCSVWVYTGGRIDLDPHGYSANPWAERWAPKPTTVRDWPYMRAGLSPLLRLGCDGLILDAMTYEETKDAAHAARSYGFDVGLEPMPLTYLEGDEHTPGRYIAKSRGYYSILSMTWDAHLVNRPDRYAPQPGASRGLDPLGRLSFVEKAGPNKGKPFGLVCVVLSAEPLPHDADGLRLDRVEEIATDYHARGMIVACDFGPEYPSHRQAAAIVRRVADLPLPLPNP